jgi:hypothetical protein
LWFKAFSHIFNTSSDRLVIKALPFLLQSFSCFSILWSSGGNGSQSGKEKFLEMVRAVNR